MTDDLPAPGPLSPARQRATLAVLVAATTVVAAMQSLLNAALPTIQRDLGVDHSAVTWVVTAWLLSATVATPLLGRLGDLIGRKRTLIAVLAVVGAGSAVSALSHTLGWLLAGRVLQGLAGAVVPLSFGLLREQFPPHRLPPAIGAVSAVVAVGGGLGSALTGPVAGALGWRWLFWLPAAGVAVAAIAFAVVIRESPARAGGRIDGIAAVLLAAWLVALLLPLSNGSAWGWSNGRVLGLFGAAVLLCAAWIAAELRARHPVVNVRLMRRPVPRGANLVAVFFGAAMFTVLTFVPQLAQTPRGTGYGLGLTITGAGLLALPMLAAMAAASWASGAFARIVGLRTQLIASCVLGVLGGAGHAVPIGSTALVAVSGGVFGAGLGLAYASLAGLMVRAVPAGQTAAATGMNANLRTIGGSIGVALVGAVITGAVAEDGYPRGGGYASGFALVAAFSLAALVIAVRIPRLAAAAEHADQVVDPPLVSRQAGGVRRTTDG